MADAASQTDGRLVLAAELVHEDIWAQLAAETHEMEVTNSNRRMTPALIIRVRGLQPEGIYRLVLLFVPTEMMLRGLDGVLIADREPPMRNLNISSYVHPSGAMSGLCWMSEFIGFTDVWLTTNRSANRPKVCMDLFRRYQLVVQFFGPGNPESVVLRQLQFVTVARSASRSQMKLKTEKRGITAMNTKRKRTARAPGAIKNGRNRAMSNDPAEHKTEPAPKTRSDTKDPGQSLGYPPE
ncbi:T-box transcription factor TBX15-like [Ixodes scapularis]